MFDFGVKLPYSSLWCANLGNIFNMASMNNRFLGCEILFFRSVQKVGRTVVVYEMGDFVVSV